MVSLTVARTRSRIVSALAVFTLLSALAAVPGGARAAQIVPTTSIHLSAVPSGHGYKVTMSGTYDGINSIVVDFAHSGTAPCGKTWTAELHLTERQQQSLGYHSAGPVTGKQVQLGPGQPKSGSYRVSSVWGTRSPAGKYRVCAYLYDSGNPTTKPVASATMVLTISGSGGGSSNTGSAPFTVLSVRVQLTKRANWTWGAASIPSVTSGTRFYVVFYVKTTRSLTYSTGSWKVEYIRAGRVVGTDPWKLPNGQTVSIGPGTQFDSSTSATITTKTPVTYTIRGSLTINGTTESASTQLRINP